MTASNYPQFFRVRQKFARPRVEDAAGEVREQLARLKLGEKIKPGQSVAITAGSRGIDHIAAITRAVADYIKTLGAKPFVVAAMGSHGGATAEGQLEVLRSYGITEAQCGCEICASMETVEVGRTSQGVAIHFDRTAYEADHVLVCGRIKAHTRFSGEIESGLMKMMLLGLGKHAGATAYHQAFAQHGFVPVVRSAAAEVLKRCRIVAGLGIVENGYDETARIEAMLPAAIESREIELLKLAKELMPRLPFANIDVLVVDEMGKDISGSGMDTNVVGRKQNARQATEGETPRVRQIVARRLTEASHGNAYGIGMSAFCSTALWREIDAEATKINGVTSGNFDMVVMPPHVDTDRQLLDAALGNLQPTAASQAKIVWIKNTLHLAEAECSAAYLAEAQGREDFEVVGTLQHLPMGKDGNLPRFEAF